MWCRNAGLTFAAAAVNKMKFQLIIFVFIVSHLFCRCFLFVILFNLQKGGRTRFIMLTDMSRLWCWNDPDNLEFEWINKYVVWMATLPHYLSWGALEQGPAQWLQHQTVVSSKRECVTEWLWLRCKWASLSVKPSWINKGLKAGIWSNPCLLGIRFFCEVFYSFLSFLLL